VVVCNLEKLNFSRVGYKTRDHIKTLADFFEIPVSAILPDELRGLNVGQLREVVAEVPVERLLSSHQQLALKSPEAIICEDDMRSGVLAAVNNLGLPQRYIEVIKYQYGLDGYEVKNDREISEIMGFSRGRTAQLAKRVMYRLRHPKRLNGLRELCTFKA
jgi:hypothetical protein